jgi:hypothetical protein
MGIAPVTGHLFTPEEPFDAEKIMQDVSQG